MVENRVEVGAFLITDKTLVVEQPFSDVVDQLDSVVEVLDREYSIEVEVVRLEQMLPNVVELVAVEAEKADTFLVFVVLDPVAPVIGVVVDEEVVLLRVD